MTIVTFLRQIPEFCFVSLLTLLPVPAEPPQLLHPPLTEKTIRAFNAYIRKTDEKNASTLTSGNFLWIDDEEQPTAGLAHEKLKRGEVLLQRTKSSGSDAEIPGGMIHDWEGILFIPGRKLPDVLAILEDYNHEASYFAPDVEEARIEEHHGDDFLVFLRFRRVKIVTVVLNTEHKVT